MSNEHNKDTEGDLLKDTFAIHEKSELARKDADFNFKLICEWIKKHELDTPDNMSTEALEAAQKESNVLMSRLRISVEALKKMDAEYEALRARVNKYYGKEILSQHPPSPTWQEMIAEADKDDDGESWKQS